MFDCLGTPILIPIIEDKVGDSSYMMRDGVGSKQDFKCFLLQIKFKEKFEEGFELLSNGEFHIPWGKFYGELLSNLDSLKYGNKFQVIRVISN